MISPSVPSPDLFRCSLSTVPMREKTAPQRPLTAPRLRSSVGRTRFVARSAVRPRFVCSAVISFREVAPRNHIDSLRDFTSSFVDFFVHR